VPANGGVTRIPFEVPVDVTDLFSLARVTADELRWSEEPWRNSPCFRATRIGPLQLARLAEVLGIGRHGEVLREFSLLAGESQESPWVVSFPQELMSRVGALGEAEAGEVALCWAAAFGPAADATSEALLEYLKGLGKFARTTEGPYALYVRLGSARGGRRSEKRPRSEPDRTV
jgi:hypothetical protein